MITMRPLASEYEKRLDHDWPAIIHYLGELIAIPSVRGTAAPHAPFGLGPRRVLEHALAISASLGLTPHTVADAVGWASLGGDDDAEYVGVLSHLDVVAGGSGWHYPPFQLTETPTRLFGRGILDNKGPIFTALWALHWLQEDGVALKRPLRVIFGTDEESGSADIPFYLAAQRPPIFGFTTDGMYPVVYGERGIVRYRITWPVSPNIDLGDRFAIAGDFSPAIIPDSAVITFPDGREEHSNGRKAPSNAPWLGDNVLDHLSAAAGDLPGAAGAFFQWYTAHFAGAVAGEHADIHFSDDASGTLQLSPYRMAWDGQALTLDISIRYPLSVTEQLVTDRLAGLLPAGASIRVSDRIPPLIQDPHSPFVQTLTDIYTENTGLDGTPVTSSGATYARSMPNIVAFGPSFPGQEGIAHKEDEWLNVADFRRMLVINYLAMRALADL
ncbi:DapE [Schleiferilactobacillus shenzhenensis LY-73]|uniref:DapE n=2 Tax=Schleiferilactobacillus shenzhenensis TaxID=1231337 RepID=U4TTJ3_9LACO|nr:DapE [Schleiferilactobacillus shenzhenensis LY-73]